MILLENDDLEVLDDDEILVDFRLDEQVLMLVICEIYFEIFLVDDLDESLDDLEDEQI